MIVQPASLGPRSRPRRALRVLALVVPVVLLAGVIAVGVLGPQPEPPPDRPSDVPVAVVDASAPPAPSSPSPSPGPTVPVFPSEIAGLDVHGVTWTLEARNRGLARGLIAVAGYLGLDTIPAGCRDAQLGVFGAFCSRVGVLGEDPWYGATNTGPEPPGFHLHPQFLPGVRIPSQATFVALSPSTQTPPVIVLGRFNDDRAATCVPGGRHCGQEFVVERVAWVDGAEYPVSPAIDPATAAAGRTPATIREEADAVATLITTGGSAYPLLVAYAMPSTVASIDPALAGAAGRLRQDEPVWVARVLRSRGNPGVITWSLIDETTGRPVAGGSIETTRFPGPFGARAGGARGSHAPAP